MKNVFILALLALIVFSTGNLTAQTKKGYPKTAYLVADRNDTILKQVYFQNVSNNYKRNEIIKNHSKATPADFVITAKTAGFYKIYSFKPFGIPSMVYIQPGDTITYKNNGNNGLTFTGKNAAHYNFFNELFKNGNTYPDYNEKEELHIYKVTCAEILKHRIAFLHDYAKKHKVSSAFYNAVKTDLEFGFIGQILNKFSIPENAIKNNPKVLDGISFKTFNLQKNVPESYNFYWGLSNYVRSYSIINEPSENYSNNKLKFSISVINKNLKGDLREFALTETFEDYETHPKPENISVIKECLTATLTSIKDPAYKHELEKKLKKLLQLSADLPQEVLDAQLLDTEGNLLAVKDILKNQSNSIKVLDFWASWCGPCVAGIKDTHALREKLPSERQVVFIYISTDKNMDQWKKKVAELSALGINKNHYRLTEESYKLFSKFFLIESIPKYVVLTPANKVYLNTVLAPGSADFENVLKSASK